MKTFITSICAVLFVIVMMSNNNSYAQSSVNEHSIKFDKLNSQSATLVGDDGVILTTLDGGQSWNQSESGISNVLYGNTIVNANISYVTGENGIILKTVNGGSSWDLLNTGAVDHLKDIEVSAGKIVSCGENGTILTSSDQGTTWIINKGVTTYNLNDILLLTSGTIYIAGEHSTLLKSVDNGSTWTTIDLGLGIFNLRSIGGGDDNNLTVIGDNYTVFHTNNGGLTWMGIEGIVATSNLNNVVFFNANEGVIVGDGGFVLKTSDGGSTWNQKDINTIGMQPMASNLNSVAFSSINSGISVGQNGASIYSTDAGDSWSTVAPAQKIKAGSNSISKALYIAVDDSKLTLKQNYPNPFNPTTIISYQLPSGANVSLKVYDMLGKEVANLVNGYQATGNYNASFNGSNLSSGIYFYVLRVSGGTNEITKTMRMILTK